MTRKSGSTPSEAYLDLVPTECEKMLSRSGWCRRLISVQSSQSVPQYMELTLEIRQKSQGRMAAVSDKQYLLLQKKCSE